MMEESLAKADIKIGNGENIRPWDIKVNNPGLYKRIRLGGLTALGEAYVDGDWDCEKIDQLFDRLLRANVPAVFKNHWTTWGIFLKEKLFNRQSRKAVFSLIRSHYDKGNDLFEIMLDRRMTYTCGYWKKATDLDQAQEDKLDLVCRKIGLKADLTVLDIGSGWGSFIKFAAEKYGAKCLGITLSNNQAVYSRESCRGLPVETRIQDYREVSGKFDRIVSLGMFEHVGHKNYRSFMEAVHRNLTDEGIFLLHCFGGIWPTPNRHQPETRWVEKYIFPGMALPSLGQILTAAEGLFLVHDVQNFGKYYSPTLMAWFKNFEAGWPKIKSRYGERFYRLWKYYLLACAGGFRSGKYQLWQIVMSKKPLPGVYQASR